LRAFGRRGVIALAVVEAEIVSSILDLGPERFAFGHAVEHAQRADAVAERARASRVSGANLYVSALRWLARVVYKLDCLGTTGNSGASEPLHDCIDQAVIVLRTLMHGDERIEDDHVAAIEAFEIFDVIGTRDLASIGGCEHERKVAA
jgi:hypothetical protein